MVLPVVFYKSLCQPNSPRKECGESIIIFKHKLNDNKAIVFTKFFFIFIGYYGITSQDCKARSCCWSEVSQLS